VWCAAVVGCSTASSASSISTAAPVTTAGASGPTPSAPAQPTTRVTARRPPGHSPSRRATAPSALAVSNTSARVVQPQPPPASCHARGSGLLSLPDARCTPGAISAAVTQASIQSTICRRGYTRTVRPPASVTGPEKEGSLAAYGDTGPPHAYEYDHLVPLELGGAANDPRNLWPEPGAVPNPKDKLENRLRSMVCDGELRLAAAQREIATNWVGAYHRLVG
jgi:hypothetical protein